MAATLAATQSPATPAASGTRYASRVDALTGVRALAAGWVVAYHLWLNAAKPALSIGALRIDFVPFVSMGWLGVDIFFILSGFVLTWQVLHQGRRAGLEPFARGAFWRDARSFMGRRILRVHPAYLATLTVLLPLGWYGLMPRPNDVGDVLLHLVMFHNVVAEDMPSINGVYWSMPFEFQFYLLFPLLVLPILRGYGGWLLAGGVAVALLFKLESALMGPSHAMAQLPWRIDEFVAGMAAASFAMRRHWTASRHALVAWCAALSLVAGACLIARIDPIWWQPGALPIVRAAWIDITIAALLVGICADRGGVARFFGWRPVVWLGLISYSVYLWHLPTILLTRMKLSEVFPAAPVAVHFGVVAAAIVMVSALSYYVIEKPFHAPSRAAPALWRDAGVRLAGVVVWIAALLSMAVAHGI